MRIISILITRKVPSAKPILLDGAYELSDFGYFKRGGVQEMCNFSARSLTERCPIGSKTLVAVNGT